jgi:hypothetical protein
MSATEEVDFEEDTILQKDEGGRDAEMNVDDKEKSPRGRGNRDRGDRDRDGDDRRGGGDYRRGGDRDRGGYDRRDRDRGDRGGYDRGNRGDRDDRRGGDRAEGGDREKGEGRKEKGSDYKIKGRGHDRRHNEDDRYDGRGGVFERLESSGGSGPLQCKILHCFLSESHSYFCFFSYFFMIFLFCMSSLLFSGPVSPNSD